MFLPSFRWQEHKERDTMAKFCGKCGARLDEATGLCPNCDADKLKEKPKTDKRAAKKAKKREKRIQWSTGKKIRHFFLKLTLIMLLLLILAIGIVCSLTYFGFIQSPTIIRVVENLGINRESDISRLFRAFANEYQVLSENEDGTYTLKILAPDFASILKQELEDNPTLTLNSENIDVLIDKYPDLEISYEFTVASKKRDEIQKAFLQQISYDLMVAAIMDSPISEPQEQEIME